MTHILERKSNSSINFCPLELETKARYIHSSIARVRFNNFKEIFLKLGSKIYVTNL